MELFGKAVISIFGDVGSDECDLTIVVLGDEVDTVVAESPTRGNDGTVAAVEESFDRLSCLVNDCCFHDDDFFGL